jgi:hypothetical protein
MAYTMITARRLCSAAELELVAASFASDKTAWTSARLHNKIQRTRKLRDKYRDLVRRTRAAGRGASGGRYGAQPKTQMLAAQRVKLFDETLVRYIAKLTRLDASERAAKEREAGKRKLQGLFARGTASPGTGSRPRAGKTKEQRASTPSAPSKRRPGPRHAVKAHVRARNQRRQASQDAK